MDKIPYCICKKPCGAGYTLDGRTFSFCLTKVQNSIEDTMKFLLSLAEPTKETESSE